MAQQLLVVNMLEYPDLKWVILLQVDRTPEQHHQRICWRWLLAEGHGSKDVIDLVVLQQFVG